MDAAICRHLMIGFMVFEAVTWLHAEHAQRLVPTDDVCLPNVIPDDAMHEAAAKQQIGAEE
jgi:hypothetical protein